MTTNGVLQIGMYALVLVLAVKPLGSYMARVYEGQSTPLDRALGPVERLIYRLSDVRAANEMNWKGYALAVLMFNAAGLLVLYALQRLQGALPLNPQSLPGVSSDSSFNTAISFASNTNWQGYGGETTMSYLTQMVGLTVQNFVSAATGMAVLVALIRGIVRRSAATIGNFWVDMTRSTLYILLPLSVVLAIALVSQGVVQTFDHAATVKLVQPVTGADGIPVTTQQIALGPAASQIAIKQLGTNGGGFFNVNSSHSLENPTPLTNFLESLSILLIPAALCYTFGKMVGDTRQGWVIFAAMLIVLVGFTLAAYAAEAHGNPRIAVLGVDQVASNDNPGGNMEGKELRFGVANSALWATATTAASNGSVNAMHDSFTPLGGLVPLFMMHMGETIFGGVGSGLYGMLAFVIVAVFVAGLMVGRTPEYLGKKIEAYEMKMVSVIILIMPLIVLVGTALALVTDDGKATIYNPGAHGFSEVLYAFTSAGNNNGSAFAGLGANTPFYNTALGISMLLARYWIIVPILALAGSLARKKAVPVGAGTLPTDTPLFVVLLIGIVIVVGALAFIPALALGPIVEHLQMAL
ncbi:MAG TPA: potassium-transporting ATPase subunit KdpA [Aggregatilinea sp.]|uniref:potassium-transporting ATPase subunit KdpA n=1 Tax=Aggregatilinea sp. TaxID=2806333 RepID=UPI002CBC7A4C|nr:potassium-transporting ATPase subunit KdpA [Aggregatilinea sp.]HML21225.1 potassium-transporting ATPase subunit KdpA [Aggregatilinea sp.]